MNGNNSIDYRMPLYIQVQEVLLKKIEEGEFLSGMKIPSERELAEFYGVSRMTVKKAINNLVELGYLYSEQGRGTFVKKDEMRKLDMKEEDKIKNLGFTSLVNFIGGKPSNKLLFSQVIKNDRFIEDKLNLEKGAKIFALGRVRYDGEVPVMVQYVYVPYDIFPDITSFDFSDLSLYEYMESREHLPVKFNVNLFLQKCGTREANLLNVPEEKIIYFYQNRSIDATGNVVEYSEEFLNPDMIVVSQYVQYRLNR